MKKDSKRSTIQFTISETEKEELQKEAESKGFLTIGAYARFALFKYHNQYGKKHA